MFKIIFTETLKTIIICFIILGSIWGWVFLYTQTPEVHISSSTGKCTYVFAVNKEYSCDNLPEKYIIVHVR